MCIYSRELAETITQFEHFLRMIHGTLTTRDSVGGMDNGREIPSVFVSA